MKEVGEERGGGRKRRGKEVGEGREGGRERREKEREWSREGGQQRSKMRWDGKFVEQHNLEAGGVP